MTEPAARILIADDEPLFLRTTAELLSNAGYECTTAADGQTASEALAREPFDLVLSDLNMPGNLKLELLREGRGKWPEIPLIVVTGAPSLPTAIESVRLGIADYLLKPIKYENLLASVRRALDHARRAPADRVPADRAATDAAASLTTDREFAESPPAGSDFPASGTAGAIPMPEIVGDSPPMRQLKEIIDRVAETDANILITGESGTGKEVVAASIHRRSRRARAPFQVIDCTAIPETLFESVLFGHVRGAFTGAVKDQAGLLTESDGGTAFFDEIGELPGPSQAKLLRVIQEQTFTPVGKTVPIRVDTRFICATNRQLELEVGAGRFRRDLFYRLAVIHIELPPLRERGDDVLLLARWFLDQLQGAAPRIREFSDETLELIRRYPWPGNIRELRNAIERGVALARGGQIEMEDLPPTLQSFAREQLQSSAADGAAGSRAVTLEAAERDYLIGLLRDNGGNVARSAQQAGMSRQGLHKLLKRHDIHAADFRS